MLITHMRSVVHPDRLVSVFWSHGILCQLVRGATPRAAWRAFIRLPITHSWRHHVRTLEQLVQRWATHASQDVRFCDVDEVAIQDMWVIVRSRDTHMTVRPSLVRQPDQYWYQAPPASRYRKKYKLSKAYMEALCCMLCGVLCAPPYGLP